MGGGEGCDHGPKKWGFEGGGFEGWGPEGWETQNFALFFPSRRKIRSFLPSLGVFLLNFGGVLKTGALKCARLGSRASCETPAAWGPYVIWTHPSFGSK